MVTSDNFFGRKTVGACSLPLIPHPISKLQKCGTIDLLPHTPSWCACSALLLLDGDVISIIGDVLEVGYRVGRKTDKWMG